MTGGEGMTGGDGTPVQASRRMSNSPRMRASASGSRYVGRCVSRIALARSRAREQASGRPVLLPRHRRVPVGDPRVEVVALHRRHRVRAAEKVPLAEHRLADRLDAERLLVHLDPAHRPVDQAVHLVVEHEGLEARPEEGRGHAGGLVDEVPAGEPRGERGDALLDAVLRVDRLGVGHRRRDARRQSEPVRELWGRGRVQHRDLGRRRRRRRRYGGPTTSPRAPPAHAELGEQPERRGVDARSRSASESGPR